MSSGPRWKTSGKRDIGQNHESVRGVEKPWQVSRSKMDLYPQTVPRLRAALGIVLAGILLGRFVFSEPAIYQHADFGRPIFSLWLICERIYAAA
jgi:hypothetical protein